MTPDSKDFVSPLVISTLSKNPVGIEFWNKETGSWNNHVEYGEWADVFLILGIIGSLLFMATAIYEVRSSTRISHREKTMWTIAFLFLNGFTGFIYFFLGRRRIA
jgi:fluoride ion exporter CrcB/FEX